MESATEAVTAPRTDVPPPTVLIVDDEPNIVAALHRLLREPGYNIVTAGGGAEALAKLAGQTADLVISDMRMPEMSGAELLAEVARRWPDTVRIVLTGYADLETTVQAVNHGHIHYYFSKPWDSKELLATIRHALDVKLFEDERKRLLSLLEAKNRELGELNKSLEEKVRQRTEHLRMLVEDRDNANLQLRAQFFETIRTLSKIIELRPGLQLGFGKIVAEQSQRVAAALSLPPKDTQDIIFAGLLFQLGRLTLPERMNERPFYKLNSKERERVLSHPEEGAMLIGEIGALKDVATIIRHQNEKFDGSGLPDHLVGDAIPIGSRILTLVRDYNLVLDGAITGQKGTTADAQNYVLHWSGSHYDPKIAETYLDIFGRVKKNSYRPVVEVLPCQLMEGMDIVDVTHQGKVYLQGGVLDQGYIEKIMALRDELGIHLKIRIRAHI